MARLLHISILLLSVRLRGHEVGCAICDEIIIHPLPLTVTFSTSPPRRFEVHVELTTLDLSRFVQGRTPFGRFLITASRATWRLFFISLRWLQWGRTTLWIMPAKICFKSVLRLTARLHCSPHGWGIILILEDTDRGCRHSPLPLLSEMCNLRALITIPV